MGTWPKKYQGSGGVRIGQLDSKIDRLRIATWVQAFRNVDTQDLTY